MSPEVEFENGSQLISLTLMLIIGCGNFRRGDDAAGVLVAERLRARGLEVTVCSGEASELIELWRGVDAVIVIDAVMTGAPVGTIHEWDGESVPTLSKVSGSTHGFGVGEAIELSRVLECLPARLRVFGIEGRAFEIGGTMAVEVGRGIEAVTRRILGETQG